jgi:hypothetical protein
MRTLALMRRESRLRRPMDKRLLSPTTLKSFEFP